MTKLSFFTLGLCVTGLALTLSCANTAKLTAAQKPDQPPPSEVVKVFYELCEKGKLEEAGKLLTNTPSTSIVMATGPVNWPLTVHDKKILFRKISSESIADDKAEVVVVLKDVDGVDRPFMHFLYKLNGKWKLISCFETDLPICVSDPRACHIIEKTKSQGGATQPQG